MRDLHGLELLLKSNVPPSSVFLLSDFHPYVDDPVHVRLLRDIALGQAKGNYTVIFPFSHGNHPGGT